MIQKINDYLYKNLLNNQRFLFLFSIMCVELYLFPLYYYGQDAQVKIFDNLDIIFPVYKVLASSGMIFSPSDAIVPNMMGGLPRLVYWSEFNVYLWLFYFFPPFVAFTINETMIHLGAFFSMYILLNRYFVPSRHRYRLLMIHGVSIMFAFLPFNIGAGLSVPSVPLALYVFLNIRNAIGRWHDWVIIVLIPFYSSLVLVYFFFLVVMSGLLVIDFIKNRSLNRYFFLALAVMSLTYVVVEYRLFYDAFIGHLFISHRTEFGIFGDNSLFETYRSAHETFLNGTIDMDTRASAVIIPFVFLVLVMTLVQKRLSWYWSLGLIAAFCLWLISPQYGQYITGNKFAIPIITLFSLYLVFFRVQYRSFALAILMVIAFSYCHALWFYEGTDQLAKLLHFQRDFNLARITMLLPVVWMVAVVFGMVIMFRKIRFATLLFVTVVLGQSYTSLNIRQYSAPNSPNTVRGYFAQDLFTQIKQYLKADPSTYRVGCIGFEPAIAVYNGLYTIDGYITSYPLEYKHKFYKIIEKSVQEEKEYKKLFVQWGSKCYLFDGGESSLHYRQAMPIKKISLDFEAYKALGGDYLLSSHRIEESQLKHLVFLKEFRDKNTYWRMYLYRVDLSKQ